VVEGTKPIVYFRLESAAGTSRTGGVTVSSSCAPTNVPNDHCLVFNGTGGLVTTTGGGSPNETNFFSIGETNP